METTEIIIPLSKKKIVLLTLGSAAFVAVGFYLLSIASIQHRYLPAYVDLAAVLAIGFFGFCGLYGFFKLFDNKPGLIINEKGIFDNASAVSGGGILWNDILRLDIQQVERTKFLLIFVKNPEAHLKAANRFKRFWMKLNQKYYGTPLSISSASLKCSFDEIIEMISDYREKYTNTTHKHF